MFYIIYLLFYIIYQIYQIYQILHYLPTYEHRNLSTMYLTGRHPDDKRERISGGSETGKLTEANRSLITINEGENFRQEVLFEPRESEATQFIKNPNTK